MPLKEIMVALMYWISALTGYNVHVPPPSLVFLTPMEVVETCMDEGALVPVVAEACYKKHEHRVFLRDSFDITDSHDVGVLVHELTHVLQMSNEKNYNLSTMYALEREANQIENMYVASPNVQERLVALLGRKTAVAEAGNSGPAVQLAGSKQRVTAGCSGGQCPVPGNPSVVAKSSPAGRPAGGRWAVHLESYSSYDKAVQAAGVLRARHRELAGRTDWNVTRVDLGAKGVYYRVFAGPVEKRSEAEKLAGILKRTEKYAGVIPLD